MVSQVIGRQGKPVKKRAIDFPEHSMLVGTDGRVAYRGTLHIVRKQYFPPYQLSIMLLEHSSNIFELAPPGTSLIVSNDRNDNPTSASPASYTSYTSSMGCTATGNSFVR